MFLLRGGSGFLCNNRRTGRFCGWSLSLPPVQVFITFFFAAALPAGSRPRHRERIRCNASSTWSSRCATPPTQQNRSPTCFFLTVRARCRMPFFPTRVSVRVWCFLFLCFFVLCSLSVVGFVFVFVVPSCNGAIVSDAEGGDIVQMSGDQRTNIHEFLVDQQICVASQVSPGPFREGKWRREG